MSALLRTEIHREDDGDVVIRCVGELDMSSVGELVEAIEWSRTPGLRLLRIDAKRLDFVDSSGLHCLVDAQERCDSTGIELEVVAGSALLSLLRAAGMADRLRLAPDVVATP